jgi:protein SCO1/2
MRRTNFLSALMGLLCACALMIAATGSPARAARPGSPAPITNHVDAKRYVLTGTVQSIDVPNHQIVVDGDAIPGYMDAMSMPYTVQDDHALKTLTVGDIIHADLVVQGNDSHLENIQVTGHKG